MIGSSSAISTRIELLSRIVTPRRSDYLHKTSRILSQRRGEDKAAPTANGHGPFRLGAACSSRVQVLAIPAFLGYIDLLMVRAYASYFWFTYRYWGFAL